VAAPAEAPAATAPARAPGEPLPPLAGSDPFVRRLVGGLASHPQLAAWLVGDDLARRFVVAVVAVAEGRSPSKPLEPLTPPGGFRSRTEGGRLIVDPSSFERYDLATEVFVSIDTAGAAEAYRRLHPLFDQAYREVGDPASTFDATLSRAIATLVAVPIPEGPVELVDQGGSYHFADRGLEQRTVAEKHLLRIGPDNARRIQAKLSELAAALALPPA
jgi:hypothetical protein